MAKAKTSNRNTKAKVTKTNAKPGSIRTWLAGNLGKGITLADAVTHAAKTKRSEVTVRRQAAELGYRVKGGEFVKASK